MNQRDKNENDPFAPVVRKFDLFSFIVMKCFDFELCNLLKLVGIQNGRVAQLVRAFA